MDLGPLEYSLLKQELQEESNDVKFVHVKAFCSGQYGNILDSDLGKTLLQEDEQNKSLDIVRLIQKNLEEYLDKNDDRQWREFEVLLVAVSCLQLFVQKNWLGPSSIAITPNHALPDYMYTDGKVKVTRDQIEAGLSADGEPVYPLTMFPEYLLIARTLLIDCREQLTNIQTVDWWALRCIGLQQKVLDNKSNTLREIAFQLMQKVETLEPLMTDDQYRDLQIQFHLEAGYMCYMYYGYREAKVHFNTATKISQLQVELTGVMGKRTRFQETNKAQLVLQVKREDGDQLCLDTPPASTMPKNLNLEDDTVLDNINLEEEQPTTALTATEQALVLGLMENHRRSKAADETLVEEEVLAYLSYVLNQVRSWCVSVSALLLRSKLQRLSSRRVDRSMRQLEELYNETKKEEPPVDQRIRLFYSVSLCPAWDIQKQLADILISLGAIGSALEIYERLQMWEEAIMCYQRMGKVEKAETVIREQLAIKETPNLWCFLGDVTGGIQHYEKAWELSNHRSARAQRCMGYLYFRKEDYDNCLECFRKSLSVNALQVPVWFTYGCAAMAAKDFELAIKAFKRCVSIDYDNFEGWTNLASSYVKLGEKQKAFMALNDALKCNYHNWRIWDNYMAVATDIGEFSQAIRAYNMLMDMREKWIDTEVLGVLVRAVTENLVAANGKTADSLEPNLRKLFGRITARVTDNAEIWKLYAKLASNDQEKTLQCLQKAHRCVMQKAGWEKDLKQCEEIGQASLELADTYCQCSEKTENPTQSIQLLSSAKLMLRGVLSKIKQQHTDPITKVIVPDMIREKCSSLEEKMNCIVEKITELKGS